MLNSGQAVLACDFETTTTAPTRVWAAAYALVIKPGAKWFKDQSQIFYDTEATSIDPDIDTFMANLISLKIMKKDDKPADLVCYFHNLKFDGEFILSWLLSNGYMFTTDKKLYPGEFNTLISNKGQFYSITVNAGRRKITFLDSLKIIPLSLREAGKAFKTKHQKTEMQYDNKESLDDCTDKDIEYIINDVLVLREMLISMYQEIGLEKLGQTIGSTCMKEYQSICESSPALSRKVFVDLTSIETPSGVNADQYIRRSYRGGYCMCLRPGRYVYGCTYDVNSLYPSVMHSKSGSLYPVGNPTFWKGNYIPSEAKEPNRVYIVRFKAKFDLKEGYLPTVQIKGSPYYRATEYLTTNRIGNSNFGISPLGELVENIPELTMTSVDFEMFLEHYDTDVTIIDGCWFNAEAGLFDQYINHWMSIKEKSKGGRRTIAKLFLNNLYGKLASSSDSSYKVPKLVDGVVKYDIVVDSSRKVYNVAIGSFITAYARRFTITAAQANYDNFIYADTDSIHITGDTANSVVEHPTELLCWKRECDWDDGIFIRQKTYMEHVTHKDREPVKKPYWDIKACGCPQRCKDLFMESVDRQERVKDKSPQEIEWVKTRRKITDFKKGITIPGKLRPKRVPGGIILDVTNFTIK